MKSLESLIDRKQMGLDLYFKEETNDYSQSDKMT